MTPTSDGSLMRASSLPYGEEKILHPSGDGYADNLSTDVALNSVVGADIGIIRMSA